jgi:hypothetical protein
MSSRTNKKSKPKTEEIEDKELVPTESKTAGRADGVQRVMWVQEFHDATKRFTVFTVTTAQTGSPGVVLHRPVFSETNLETRSPSQFLRPP